MLTRSLSRIILACALFATVGSVAVVAQGPYPRIRVVEEWSSATCGPCAGATPIVNAAVKLDSNVVSIRYHMHFPQPNDPWNLYNPNEPVQRYQYYDNSGGLSIPNASTNGSPLISPLSESQFHSQIRNITRTSPIQVTVTQEGGKIKVRVKSDIALKAHKLHLALISRHISFPNVQAVRDVLQGSSSNGETEFADILNKMYPDANGTDLNMNAGGDQTFEFTPTIPNNDLVFPRDQQYAIAFVQSNTTKEILQGGVTADMTSMPHKFNYLARTKVTASIPSLYNRIDRGATTETDVVVTNNGTSPVTADLTVNNASTLGTNFGIVTSVSPAVVSLAANESKTVKVSVTAPAGRSAFISVDPLATATDGISAGPSAAYYLISGARVVNYYGFGTNAWVPVTNAALLSPLSADVVYMPFSPTFLEHYPATEFDASVFSFGIEGRFQPQTITLSTIQSLVAAGKGVWMSGQVNMYVFHEPGQLGGNTAVQSTRDFYKNVLGIDYAGIRVWVVNNQLLTFPARGVANDSIGGAIGSFTGNQRSQAWQTYAEASDIIRLTASSKAKPWLYYKDSANLIGGVRVVTPSGARLVYSSLDMGSVFDPAARQVITEQVLNYILNKPASTGPILTLATQALQYGNVAVGGSKDLPLQIRNTGTDPLVISSITVEGGEDRTSFTITAGGISSGNVTVAPGGTHNLTVRFSPTTQKTGYMASLEFASNSPDNPQAQLRGNGVITDNVETDVTSETGAIGLRLIGANPATDASAVELRSLTHTTITIVDGAGRTVSTIFNGVANGTQQVSLQTSTLAAGTYSVIATNGSESAVLTIVVVR